MAMPSFAAFDLYGSTPPGRKPGDTKQAQTQAASGMKTGNENAPASMWLGMIIALVLLRVVWEVK